MQWSSPPRPVATAGLVRAGLAVCILVFAALPAAAQRGAPSGSWSTHRGARGERGDSLARLEESAPALLALRFESQLSLSGPQIAALNAAVASADSAQRPIKARIDSLRTASPMLARLEQMRSSVGSGATAPSWTPDELAQLRRERVAMSAALNDLYDAQRQARRAVAAILSPRQRDDMAKLVTRQPDEADQPSPPQ